MLDFLKILRNVVLSSTRNNISYGLNFIRNGSQKTSFDDQFIIEHVTPRDYKSVITLYKYSYFNNEPPMMAIGLSYTNNPVMENRLLDYMSEGVSLLAKCRRTGNLVGACINGGMCPWDPDLLDNFADNCTCHKLAVLLHFYAHISRESNLWERFNEKKIFELMYVTTDINNLGKGIGYQLLKKSIELAKDLSYSAVRGDAVSAFSQKICKKLNMHMVYELPYKAYVDCDGKPVILPPPPHEVVQVFVTFPHSSPEDTKKLLANKTGVIA